jgi:hypothetical protein
MNQNIIEIFNSQYKSEGGCWNKNACLVDGKIETYSGNGSLLRNTENLIASLNRFIKEKHIKSIIDAPCGDFNYMKEVELSQVEYTGYDVSSNAIELCKKYEKDNIRFEVKDITKDKLPYADLIICKDLFIHLSYEHIKLILQNVIDSGCKYFATSRYEKGVYGNTEKESSESARTIEVTTSPFDFNKEIIETFKYTNNSNLKDELIVFCMN